MKGFGLLPAMISRVSSLSKQKFVRFSSSLADSPGVANSYNDQKDESLVYKHKLVYQRPDTIEIMKFQQPYYNSVSFIGSVLFRPRLVNSSSSFGAYTWLEVKYPKDPDTNFRIFLNFWNNMAEISLKHVQKNDTIYVSGRLGTMTKVDLSGNETKTFKLAVNELNFVENYPYCETKESEKRGLKVVSEDGDGECPVYVAPRSSNVEDSSCKEEKVDRLRLWQIFFANPREWHDNRERKKTNPKLPDFSHKYTNEALWFKANDPSWVRRQIERYDSEQVLRGFAKSYTRKGFGDYLGSGYSASEATWAQIRDVSLLLLVCPPKGKYKAFVSTEAETYHPETELQPGIELLGPVGETFFDIYDRYEPTNKDIDGNCYISISYDATTHFESTVTDVIAMYSRISGKELDLTVDLSAASAAASE